MAKGYTIRLHSPALRTRAQQLIERAPDGYVCEIRPPTRSNDQNAKLWAMLTDISLAKPEGRRMTPDQWKCVFMQACGWEVQFLEGLDGQPFPAGFRSSQMSVKQMADLITFIAEYGDRHGVRWSEPDLPSTNE
jgi:hypothetical protein